MIKKILFLAVAVCAVGCSSDDTPKDSLPEATTTGANTAGAVIDGHTLIAKNGLADFTGTPYGISVGAGINFNAPIVGDDYFYVRIVDYKDSPTYDIWLQINTMQQGAGSYTTGQPNGMLFMDGADNPFIVVTYYDGVNVGKTYYSSANSGSITVTRFDYDNGIYSGIFTADLYNKDNPQDTIKLTNGRFDIKLATLNKG